MLHRILRKIGQAGGYAACLGCATLASAQNGTWTGAPVLPIAPPDPGNLWSDPLNWAGGVVADGATGIADFSSFDVDANWNTPAFRNPVQFDLPRTINGIVFGDSNTATPGGWEVFTNDAVANILTLGGTSPTITVNALGTFTPGTTPPAVSDDAVIRPTIAGTAGLTKAGPGVLTLANSAANTFTGGVNLNAGTLRYAGVGNGIVAGQAFTIANGATLAARSSLDGGGGRVFTVASGSTVNLDIENSVGLGRFEAGGATINVNFPSATNSNTAASTRFTPEGNWLVTPTAFPTALNISSQLPAPTPGLAPTGAVFRIAPNLSGTAGRNFNANGFSQTPVNVDNALVYGRTNSGGNTTNFGSLAGTATAVLSGGNAGSFMTYSIGALNTNTEFAGTIDHSSGQLAEGTFSDLQGGINITKVGTGTLTLSGTLAYQPTGNATINRRGGITTVSAGTLALKNNAAIPGGIVHGTAGTVITTVNVQAAGTLDVSGSTIPGGYSTAALQQVVGAGNIVGNYVHDEGVIRPANTITGTTASGTTPSTVAAGTINFANNFTWSGGDVTYDMSLNPVAGNDLINVGGLTTLTSGTVTPNFLATAPSTGTYTVLTSAGGFSGAATNIVVNWPGRGPDPIPFITGNSLQFTASDTNIGANLVWRGNNGTNPTFWDIQTTTNWQNGANPADTFVQLDSVLFDDTATSYTVDVQGAVTPAAVVVNNVTNPYIIQGTNGISGTTTFTKTGAGNLTLATPNTFTGAASLSGGGTIDTLGVSGALGTGPLTMDGVTITTASATGLSNSSLTVSGTNVLNADGPFNSANISNVPNLSGSGTLTISSNVGDAANGRWWALNSVTGFTGTLNLTGLAGAAPMMVRTTHTGGGNDFSDVVVNFSNAQVSNRQGASGTITFSFGEVHGDATSIMNGFTGGTTGRADTIWEIGALNTNSDFAGNITDPGGTNTAPDPDRPAISILTKVGAGTLTLTGAKSYTGDTNVNGGKLSIDNAYLFDTSDIYLAAGTMLDLNFGSLSTIDTIDSLFINGVSQAVGTWGRIGSGAMNESAMFTGDGMLQVTTFVPSILPGDYNDDGTVDAADYTIFRDNEGTTTVLMNDAIGGTIGAAHYTQWANNFGAVGGAAVASASAVPEPATLVLVGLGVLAVGAGRRRK